MFGITFSAALPGFLSQRLCCSQGEEPFFPCFSSKPHPEVKNDALRKGKIKVQIAHFERKPLIFFLPFQVKMGFSKKELGRALSSLISAGSKGGWAGTARQWVLPSLK